MSNIYRETGIWKLETAKKRHKCDFILAGAIGMCFKPERVADVGCGSGMYCKIFRDGFGWNTVHGFEGTPDIKSLNIYDEIFEFDLTNRMDRFENYYDLVISLEVGEHIPAEFESIFIDNIDYISSKDLVLSWAIPGQKSASGHVNTRSNDYVIDKFVNKGFCFDKKKTKFFRSRYYYKWFRNTVMVFRKGG